MSEIRYFGGNFAPLNWMYCNGQLLSIAEYTALFSLLGTVYGGDGQTTFALPNFQGRVAVGTGSGPGLSPIDLGEMAGTENVTLTSSNMAMHTHGVTGNATWPVSAEAGGIANPSNAYLAGNGNDDWASTPVGKMTQVVANMVTGVTGGNAPFSILQPYLVLNAIICVEGVYPSRS